MIIIKTRLRMVLEPFKTAWLERTRKPVPKCSSSIKKIIFAQISLNSGGYKICWATPSGMPVNFTYSNIFTNIFLQIFGHISINNPMYHTKLYLRYTILYCQPTQPLKVEESRWVLIRRSEISLTSLFCEVWSLCFTCLVTPLYHQPQA